MSISQVGGWDHARTTPRHCWRGLYIPWYTVTYVPYRANGMPSHIPQNFVFYSIIEYTVCNFLMRIEARIEKARVAVLKRREDAGIVTATPVATAPGRAEFRCSGAGTSSPPGSCARDTQAKDLSSVDVRVDDGPSEAPPGMPSLQIEVANAASSLTRKIPAFVSKQGVLRVRDQHIDELSRFGFPLAYFVVLIVFFNTK